MADQTSTERFASFDLDVMDQLRAHMDIVHTLIDVAAEHVDHEPNRASNLIYAAIEIWKAVDREAGDIHDALCRVREAEAAHG
ncbi:hypothetical protein [Sphingomonas baiyangensis]|uniref:Uncharacterized protein n=1 Tax=Sphingomonas baiyangensis TaxID=2572576 RepID=A0A4U1L5H3_9SPHN|nr:hypothetical protein [Sphingomonas baiyangensis]TKD52062.1 hypothetical protein FBR43_15965 [Sphingomonas baiyangensis]